MRLAPRRSSLAVALTSLVLVVTAAPAGADPAVPTNFVSAVVEQPADGVELEVVGNDAFVRIDVEPGIAVEILGYYDEPYLRIAPDGTVERNERSPATYLNEDRYGETDPPAEAGVDVAPRWEQVGSGGSYVWHDHRTHWMLPEAPAVADGADEAVVVTDPWVLPLVVDGREVVATGTLTWYPDESPALWWALTLLALGGFVALWVRARSATAVAALGVAVLSLVAGTTAWLGQPSEGRELGTDVVLPAIAVVLALGAVPVRHAFVRWGLTVAAGAAAGGWGLTRLDVWSRPHLPTSIPTVDRIATALAVALGIAAVASAIVVAWRPRTLRTTSAPPTPAPS